MTTSADKTLETINKCSLGRKISWTQCISQTTKWAILSDAVRVLLVVHGQFFIATRQSRDHAMSRRGMPGWSGNKCSKIWLIGCVTSLAIHATSREWGILTPYPEAEWVFSPESIMRSMGRGGMMLEGGENPFCWGTGVRITFSYSKADLWQEKNFQYMFFQPTCELGRDWISV